MGITFMNHQMGGFWPSPDEIVDAINSATAAITREGALSQEDLKIVKTNPAGGEYPVKAIHRETGGKLDVEYEDTPV